MTTSVKIHVRKRVVCAFILARPPFLIAQSRDFYVPWRF